jgi:hypothetical protein
MPDPDLTDAIEQRFVDRSTWPPGPWDDEPDRVDWVDEITGYACFVKRGPLGQWCGYVGLPPGHRYHSADYDDVPVSVHGGELTFGAPCDEADGPAAERICHVPRPGQPDDVWWLGFDCGHSWDIIPMLPSTATLPSFGRPTEYRTLAFVRAHTTSLARQLAVTRP